MKNIFSAQDRVVSTASKRIFDFVDHLALFILIVIRLKLFIYNHV